jgi:hypothetical protein
MGIRKALARIRFAWADLDVKRHELERRIAEYNTPSSTAAERRDLDRALDSILDRQSAE